MVDSDDDFLEPHEINVSQNVDALLEMAGQKFRNSDFSHLPFNIANLPIVFDNGLEEVNDNFTDVNDNELQLTQEIFIIFGDPGEAEQNNIKCDKKKTLVYFLEASTLNTDATKFCGKNNL